MLGSLNVYTHESDAFKEAERELLEEMALDVGYGIETLRARAQKQDMQERLNLQANLLDQISDVIISTDMGRAIESWNTAAESRYGVATNEALGATLDDIFSTEYPYESREQVYKTIEETGTWEGELVQVLADGRRLNVLMLLSVILDAEGNHKGMVSISRDVTERKRTQAALRVSEDRLRRFLDASPDSIFICDASSDMVEVNTTLLDIVGITREAVIGQNLLDVVPFVKGNHFLDAYRQVMETGVPFEETDIAVDPRFGNRLLSIKAIKVGDGLGVILVDVTELRQLEHERERFFTLSADMLVVLGLDGSFKRVNPAFEMTMGYSMAELEGMTTLDLMHPDERDNAVAILAKLAAGEAVIGLEIRFRRKDSEYLWLNWNAVSYLEENEIFAVARDVTQMREVQKALIQYERLEAELKKEREIGELKNWFMSLVSHEFRTPMTIIQSSSEIIRRYWDRMSDDVREKHLNHIVSQVAQLNAMLADYRLVLRAQEGRLEFQPAPQDLTEFCRNLVDEYRLTIHNQHDLKFICEAEIGSAMVDNRFLGYTIRNLLSNAIKYSPEGGEVCFTLSTEGDQLIFVVSDQGIGIPAAALEHIFEAYHRADNVGEIHGTGIGLNIVCLCVEAHGGQILGTQRRRQGQYLHCGPAAGTGLRS